MSFRLWLILGLLSAAACRAGPASTPTPGFTSDAIIGTAVPAPVKPPVSEGREAAEGLLSNLIVQVEGSVLVRHEGAASDQRIPLGIGARVATGDLLYVSGGKTAVFCGDQSLWDANPRWLTPDRVPQGIPCLAGAPPPPAPDISRLRGEMDAAPDEAAPYVLRPRGGWVSVERPLLRWHTPPGVDAVTLTLLSDDGIARPPVTVSGSETAYPAEWAPLQAGGAGYRLQISGGITSTGFSLLEAETINQQRRQTEAIQAQVDVEPGRTLVLAELLLRYGLWSEAVDLLLTVPEEMRETAVWHKLGETYLFMGLFAEAETALNQALLFAQRDNLPETEASALNLLGWATCGLGQVYETQSHWEAASQQYQMLGISEMPEEIAMRLSRATEICSLP